MDIHELERQIRLGGIISIDYYGFSFEFDMSMPHERRYFLRELFSVPYAQADIDTLLFSRFIRSGDRVLDAGANIGFTAREAMRFGASQVFCVEPEPSLAKRLSRNKVPEMTLINCALGASTGRARLYISEAHNQGHTINQKMLAIFPQVFGEQYIDVDVKTIGDVLHGVYCDIWKLDIEGAEIDVLTGDIDPMPRVIIAEIYGEKVKDVVEALSGHYVCRRAVIQSKECVLKLLSPVPGELPNHYEQTSPMYVFVLNEVWGEYA